MPSSTGNSPDDGDILIRCAIIRRQFPDDGDILIRYAIIRQQFPG